MKHITDKQAALVWLFLMLATLAGPSLVGSTGALATLSVVLVMAVALLKARAIIAWYMGIRYAPRGWRIAFELWVWITPSAIAGMWLLPV